MNPACSEVETTIGLKDARWSPEEEGPLKRKEPVRAGRNAGGIGPRVGVQLGSCGAEEPKTSISCEQGLCHVFLGFDPPLFTEHSELDCGEDMNLKRNTFPDSHTSQGCDARAAYTFRDPHPPLQAGEVSAPSLTPSASCTSCFHSCLCLVTPGGKADPATYSVPLSHHIDSVCPQVLRE